MITVKQIQDRVSQINDDIVNRHEVDKAFLRNAKIEKSFLHQLLLYVETNPSEDFLNKEKERLNKIITSLENGFDFWSKHNKPTDVDAKKLRSYYNKEMGITKFKNQLKAVNTILNDTLKAAEV